MKRFLTYLVVAVTAVLTIASCSEDKRKKALLPNISGKAGEVIVVIERIAAHQSFQRKAAALPGAVFLHRFQRVLGTGGNKPAARGSQRGNAALVEPDQSQKEAFHLLSSP